MHLKKDHTNALVHRQHFLEIRNNYSDFIKIYTDGPQDGGAVASAAVFPSEIISKRLDNSASIFSAQAQAIIDALDNIYTHPNSLFSEIHFHVSRPCNG